MAAETPAYKMRMRKGCKNIYTDVTYGEPIQMRPRYEIWKFGEKKEKRGKSDEAHDVVSPQNFSRIHKRKLNIVGVV